MSHSGTVRILGIAGSLRRGSFNAAALRAAQDLAPTGMTIEIFDLAPIPMYNDDVRLEGYPPPVADFRARIKAADGLLLATPDYNYFDLRGTEERDRLGVASAGAPDSKASRSGSWGRVPARWGPRARSIICGRCSCS